MLKENNIGNYPIKTMFIELLKRDLEIDNLPDEIGDAELAEASNRQWFVSAQIDAMPARNHGDLTYKCRALQLRAERDPDFDCHVPGSARTWRCRSPPT
jgi:hypothetical protein